MVTVADRVFPHAPRPAAHQPRVLLSLPQAAPPAHEITQQQLLDASARLYPQLKDPERSLSYIRRMIENGGVRTRRWIRPLDRVLSTSRDLDAELAETVAILGDLAVAAASRALEDQGLAARDITGIIVTSVTGWVMPGIDVRVINELGLPQTIRRLPAAQIGCAGGVWAAGRAWEQLAVYPDDKILIISAEAFSAGLHADDISTPAFVYRAIAADGVFACIASGDVLGAGLQVLGAPLDFTLYDSERSYELLTGARGTVFTSEASALQCVPKAMPAVREWLGWEREDGFRPQFYICHSGGVRVLETVAEELGLSRHDLRHSWESLEQDGNQTSATIWNVLRRTHGDPPPDGAPGLMLAFGPGFTVAALKVAWRA